MADFPDTLSKAQRMLTAKDAEIALLKLVIRDAVIALQSISGMPEDDLRAAPAFADMTLDGMNERLM